MDDGGVPPPHRASPGSGNETVSSGHGPRTTGHASPDPGPLTTDHVAADEAMPFGLSWSVLYGIVAGTLAVLILLFSLFTRAFE